MKKMFHLTGLVALFFSMSAAYATGMVSHTDESLANVHSPNVQQKVNVQQNQNIVQDSPYITLDKDTVFVYSEKAEKNRMGVVVVTLEDGTTKRFTAQYPASLSQADSDNGRDWKNAYQWSDARVVFELKAGEKFRYVSLRPVVNTQFDQTVKSSIERR